MTFTFTAVVKATAAKFIFATCCTHEKCSFRVRLHTKMFLPSALRSDNDETILTKSGQPTSGGTALTVRHGHSTQQKTRRLNKPTRLHHLLSAPQHRWTAPTSPLIPLFTHLRDSLR
jgi:hypothetical protein